MKESKQGRSLELPHPQARLEPATEEQRSKSFTGLWGYFQHICGLQVSSASLAIFRIGFGLIMSLEAWSLFQPNPSAITQGSSPLETYYTGANIHFHMPFAWFDWLPIFSPAVIKMIVGLMALGGILTALGLFYRLAIVTLFLSWGYLFAVESTRTYWQSHYYLELLTAFLLLWMPAANCFSLDARRRKTKDEIPFWPILLLRGQLIIAYFFAGVAKINSDWLLDAVPVRWFLARPYVTESFRPYLPETIFSAFTNLVHSTGFAFFLSYTGLLFDLVIGFLFLFRRTRFFAMALMLIFHLTNHFLIFDDIGWFPLLGLATATIFFAPDWPTPLCSWLRKPQFKAPDWNWFMGGAIVFPAVGAALGWKSRATQVINRSGTVSRATAALILGWLLFQTLLPMRHYAIPGDGRFTYEGLSFSWRLKADVHHALPARIYLEDSGLIGADETVQWQQWHGEPILYHELDIPITKWETLPPWLITADNLSGERIIYNPPAGTSESSAHAQVLEFWRTHFGREPRVIQVSAPSSSVLKALSESLRAGGATEEANQLVALEATAAEAERRTPSVEELHDLQDRMTSLLLELQARDPSGQVRSLVDGMQPFSFQSEFKPVLIIGDPALVQGSNAARKVNRQLWMKQVQVTSPGSMDIYAASLENVSANLPLAVMVQRASRSFPEVYWNIQKDVTISKGIHISNQAFYLRRYARRVANLWQTEYGRRPRVHAMTAVSFNGRPHQLLVDPNADLASVPVHWFRHNTWIRDLELKRISRSALSSGTKYVGER